MSTYYGEKFILLLKDKVCARLHVDVCELVTWKGRKHGSVQIDFIGRSKAIKFICVIDKG